MSVLGNLEPAGVFHYFEEICNIPHGSGNVERISNYLKEFAKERNLECIQDEYKNIIIIKEATAGYENDEPMIIQGHMDMVTVAKPDYSIDFIKDPLKICNDGEFVYAEGTSLGGDDGIAVAFALAILDADDICHPRLEVVITTDEEVGMDGAIGIDLSMLQGKRMLNLDQEEEGILLTSCAGGGRADVRIPLESVSNGQLNDYTKDMVAVEIQVKDFKGGHSGIEIIKGSGNSNYLMVRLLYAIAKEIPLSIAKMQGGLADNAIPRETFATVLIKADAKEAFITTFDKNKEAILKEFGTTDPEANIQMWFGDVSVESVYTEISSKKALACVLALPNGVQTMSADVQDLVETSLNLGIMTIDHDELCVSYAVRSSVDSAKYALIDRMTAVAELSGASIALRSIYPGWSYRKDSPLREKVVRIYREMFKKEPVVTAVHAGLECGILSEKIENLDCISIGPDMQNVHTTEERLNIASTKRTWEYVLAILADKQ